MRVAISGSTGFIGTALARSLRADGHDVVRLVRGDPPYPGSELVVPWDPAKGTIDPTNLRGVDAVVNLSGNSFGAKRLSESEKRGILDSRVPPTRLLAETIAGLDDRPRVMVSASGISFYGSHADEELTEASPRGDGFMADLCVEWEAATGAAEAAGVRVVHLRSGLVVGRGGGLLDRPVPILRMGLAPLFKLGLGGRLGSGRQWWSWVSLDDEVGALRFLLEHDIAGPVNLTAPEPVRNVDFTKVLGRVLHRPTVFPVPAFALRAVLGRELADELALAGQRVLPRRLLDAGYEFRFPDLEPALRATLE
jgi:uncharacterized protein (TIGR01777 family)